MTRRTIQGRNWCIAVIGAALGVSMAPGPAHAMRSCEGTIAATPLHPLPDHPTVGLDVRDSSPQTKALGDQFIAGLKLADVTVGPMPDVLLFVSGSSLGDRPGRSGGPERNYSDMSVFQGGIDHSLPQMPSGRIRGARTPPPLPTLFIRAEATLAGDKRVAWVASIQCKRTGTDDAALATDLGREIGAVLGQRIANRRL